MTTATASTQATATPATAHSAPLPQGDDDCLLTVAEVAELLRCKPSSVYNLSRSRGRSRYDNPIPIIKLPCGLRFRRSAVMEWLKSLETRGGQQ